MEANEYNMGLALRPWIPTKGVWYMNAVGHNFVRGCDWGRSVVWKESLSSKAWSKCKELQSTWYTVSNDKVNIKIDIDTCKVQFCKIKFNI